MSISGIISSTFLQNQLSGASNPSQKQIQQLSQDLQSGNLSAARSDFATLQQSFSQSTSTASATSTATASNPIAQAFNQLASDLQSGNLSAAQKDLSTVQQDIQPPQGTPAANLFNHRSHLAGGGSSTSQGTLDGQSVTSNSLSAAQQSYSAFQQELQRSAFGGGVQASEIEDQPLLSLVA
jgi:hypothetical protein